MQEPIEVYLKRLRETGYSEEQLEYVKDFREKSQHMSWEQYEFLKNHNALTITRKLKTIRNMYVFENKIYYLCHYRKAYQFSAIFKGEIEE